MRYKAFESDGVALLLEKADNVLSKEYILSQAWQDKNVSEQAVFYNIRSIFSFFLAIST